MEIKPLVRNLQGANFTDMNGQECSIQESSVATLPCLWLGVNTARMHLTQEQVSELLPHLQQFADTGSLHAGGKIVVMTRLHDDPCGEPLAQGSAISSSSADLSSVKVGYMGDVTNCAGCDPDTI